MADKLLKMFSLNVTNNSSFISNLCDFLNCEEKKIRLVKSGLKHFFHCIL